ncbi:hypothetical protein Purlil1_3774 [Purpureocillium lilacinum]|uniref:Uncharacterized protein n=1 Tax=Purpureocillium lilacinum TaxID=33203 RepID=A0ABR0C6T2_PURLI|nr:hypothetical protein Purlil1_3774 [Purpureocillium lilacinum]
MDGSGRGAVGRDAMVLCGTGWADVWWWWWCFAERKTIVTGRDGALGGGGRGLQEAPSKRSARRRHRPTSVRSFRAPVPDLVQAGASLRPPSSTNPARPRARCSTRTLQGPHLTAPPAQRDCSAKRRRAMHWRERPHPVLVTYLSLLGNEVRPGRPQWREVTTDPSSPPVPSIPPTGLEPPPAATCMERPSSTGRPRPCSGSHTAPRYPFPVKPAHRPSRQAGSGRAPVWPETLDLSARRATLRGLETSTNVRIRTYVRIVSHRSPGPETHVAGFLKNLGRQNRLGTLSAWPARQGPGIVANRCDSPGRPSSAAPTLQAPVRRRRPPFRMRLDGLPKLEATPC